MVRGKGNGRHYMTLIITVQHEDWVAMASDRMLSVNGNPVKQDAIKLVFYYCDMIFGYTGRATLVDYRGNWVPTDLWLTGVLETQEPRSVGHALGGIRDNANDIFAWLKRGDSAWKSVKQAFMGVGWRRDPSDVSITTPTACVISNFHSDEGAALDKPRDAFHALGDNLDYGKRLRTLYVGYPRQKKEQQKLLDELDECARRRNDIRCITHAMKRSIRSTSNRLNDKWVGKDVMVGTLPRKIKSLDRVAVLNNDVSGGVFFGRGRDDLTDFIEGRDSPAYFFDYPESDIEVHNSPHVVCPGFSGQGVLFAGGVTPHVTYGPKDSAGNVGSIRSAKFRDRRDRPNPKDKR